MMRRSVSGYIGCFHVRGVALRFGTTSPAVGASAAAPAAVPGQVIRAGAGMASGVISLPALLDDPLNDLSIG